MKEATLNRLKAERCTTGQLIDEINRIANALAREDTRPKQAARYLARMKVYRDELAGRAAGGKS